MVLCHYFRWSILLLLYDPFACSELMVLVCHDVALRCGHWTLKIMSFQFLAVKSAVGSMYWNACGIICCSVIFQLFLQTENERSPDLGVNRHNIATGLSPTPIAARESHIRYQMAMREDAYTDIHEFTYVLKWIDSLNWTSNFPFLCQFRYIIYCIYFCPLVIDAVIK